MSEEHLRAFLKAVQGDSALQERLKAAEDLDAVVAIAKEAGFSISKAEMLEAEEQQAFEFSDEELENVAGGRKAMLVAKAGGCCLTADIAGPKQTI
jgi:predicted ribosomally synthesized peptide with nif11-like leader